MVAILKSDKGKPMLVLKHSEVSLWQKADAAKRQAVQGIAYVFVYFGYYMPAHRPFGFEDGWITLKDTVKDVPKSLIWLNFGGANFLEPPVQCDEAKLPNSLCCVTNDTPRKGLHSLLFALFFVPKDTTITLVIQQNATSVRDRLYARGLAILCALLHRCFGSHLVLYRSGIEGRLPRDKVYHILARSQFLVLPSFGEGAARVVGEAQLHKTRVIMRKKMRGSTHLLLSPNDRFFSHVASLVKQLRNRVYVPFEDKELKANESQFLAKHTTALFFKAAAENGIFLTPVALSNLFSGQRNILPAELTGNDNSDQIASVFHMNKVLDLLINQSE